MHVDTGFSESVKSLYYTHAFSFPFISPKALSTLLSTDILKTFLTDEAPLETVLRRFLSSAPRN